MLSSSSLSPRLGGMQHTEKIILPTAERVKIRITQVIFNTVIPYNRHTYTYNDILRKIILI